MGWNRYGMLIPIVLCLGMGCNDSNIQEVPQACGLETSQECAVDEGSWIRINSVEELASVCEDACEQVYGLSVADLRDLEELTGFSWLKRVEGSLNISGLRSARTLRGFDNLEFSNSVVLENNFSLERIEGFGSLREVNQLKLRYMDGIDTIHSFDNLEYIGPADDLGDDNFGFFLSGMNGMTHLEGLHKVREAGFVVIQN